jgi:Cadherin cytoplasmic region
VCILLLLVAVLTRRRQQQREAYAAVGNPDEDIRENIIHYDEEGVGM